MKQNFAFYLYLVTLLAFPSYALTDSYKEFIDGKNVICGDTKNVSGEIENNYYISFTSTEAIYVFVGRIGDEYKKLKHSFDLGVYADKLKWNDVQKYDNILDRSSLILTIKQPKGGYILEVQCKVIELDEAHHMISDLINKEQKQYDKRRVMNKI